MSGAARRRGAGRATGGETSEASSRRGDRRPHPGAFDGPSSRGSNSGAGAQLPRGANTGPCARGSPTSQPGGSIPHGSQPGSRRTSVSGTPAQTAQALVPHGDPARDGRPRRQATGSMKNVDLPASTYALDKLYALETQFSKRPGFNTTGKQVNLALNCYQVMRYPAAKIYQYDIIMGNGDEKPIVRQKVWNSRARKERTDQTVIYDGNKLAWSLKDYGEIRVMVDLDAEDGRGQSRGTNSFRLHIRKSRELDLGLIMAYLNGRTSMSLEIAEAVLFLDHLLRAGPSANPRFIPVKRSFFIRDGQRADLGGSIEVFRGVYQSLRLVEGAKMVINLDVANTCFWKPTALTTAIMTKYKKSDMQQIAASFRPTLVKGILRKTAEHLTMESTLKRLTVRATYQGNPFPNKEWKIKSISTTNATEERLDWKDPQTKQPTGQMVTIAAYFKRKYNLTLQYPQLPLVEMTKKGVLYPMEFLQIPENQRYGSKLDETQTANMIKFAVSPPSTRLQAINEGKSWLNWSGDSFLNAYGLEINSQPVKTAARILPPPGIKFGAKKVEQPGTKGRWDLKGKQFLTGNPQELVSWGVGVFPGRIPSDKPQIEKFCQDFARAYRGHGGKVANGLPHIAMLPHHPGQAVETLHQSTGNKFQRRPQLLVFLVQDKSSFNYMRIKKSCDCRYGVVSQVMQIGQVLKGSPQYYSNVLMKVNAKLGGCTSQVQPAPGSGFKAFAGPTMFIGADVSHAAPGSLQASMAAVTVSFDRHAGRYAAACQTNGHRVEMITEVNMRSMLGPLIQEWTASVGSGSLPGQVYYIRDGVSAGEFEHVINQEVPHIRGVLDKIAGKSWGGKMTVIIANKRHHVRAFPKQGEGDPKGNPLPGTLIEHDVTMPNEFDFYLYSHIALQGTSRPVHYTILHDDAKHSPNVISNIIYEHCYQYMRSTTSVSLHPAVYYAHLASNRARSHEDIPSSDGPQSGPGYKQNQPPSSEGGGVELKPLLPMFDVNKIATAMWYI